MKEIIAQGLKKIEKYKKAVDCSEGKLEAVKAIKSIIQQLAACCKHTRTG